MNRRPIRELVWVICLLAIPIAGLTLPWDKDMKNQPSNKPQDSVIEKIPTSVPHCIVRSSVLSRPMPDASNSHEPNR